MVIENFRPDTLERWGLGYDVLSADNPGLVLARVTGFGQIGPYRRRPGFGTLAEAMSGFAAATGEPDGPPTLPPFGLADGIASLATAYAIMVALHARTATGRGQVIDLAIVEPIMAMLGPQITRWDQLGTLQPRTGNRSSNNAPRNTYRTGDGHWVAVSTSSQSIAERLLRLVGRPDLVDQPWFATGGPGPSTPTSWTRRSARGSRLGPGTRCRLSSSGPRRRSRRSTPPRTSWPTRSWRPSGPSIGSTTPTSGRWPCRDRCSGCRPRRRRSGTPAGRPAADTDPVLRGLGYDDDEIGRLRAAGVVA